MRILIRNGHYIVEPDTSDVDAGLKALAESGERIEVRSLAAVEAKQSRPSDHIPSTASLA